MPFNERGEIIRGQSNGLMTEGDQSPSDSWTWIVPFTIIIAIVVFTALGIYYSQHSKPKSDEMKKYAQQWDSANLPSLEYMESDINFSDTQSITSSKKINPYGSGNGKLVIYKFSLDIGYVEISIDGHSIGALSRRYQYLYSKGTPLCDDPATISTILPAGNYSLYAKDNYGHYWVFMVSVAENECTMQEIKLEQLNIDLFHSKFAKILDGTWYGKVYQSNLKMPQSVLFGYNRSKREFKIIYPSLGYISTWELYSVYDKSIEFTESISYGKGKESLGDRMRLKIIDNKTIEATYYSDGEVNAKGTLLKVKK